MKYAILFIPLLFLLFSSCNPIEEIPENEIVYDNCSLTKVKINGTLIQEYEYNSFYNITSIITKNGLYGDRLEVRTYDLNQQLIKRTFYDEQEEIILSSTFEYFLPDSIRRNNYNATGELERYDIYRFDPTAGCPYLGRDTYDANTGELMYYYTATTLDKSCSVQFTDYDSTGNIIKRTDYWVNSEYKGAYSEVLLPFFWMYNRYLLESVEVTDINGNIVKGESYNSAFTYNASDYPITENRQYQISNRDFFEYEYTCY